MSSFDDDFLKDDNAEDTQGWMATYSDMVTLLMCFFILMFAMSTIEKHKFEQIAQTLRKSLGKQNVPESGTREGLSMKDVDSEKQPNAVDELGGLIKRNDRDSLISKVEEFIFKNKLAGKVNVESNESGAIITISDVVLFPTGADDITQNGLEIMSKIQNILKQFSYEIKVVGHTDNRPIVKNKLQFESNWELSAARACEIVRFLIDNGIDPELLSAVGQGPYHPIATNETPAGRAKNRRVEIVYERIGTHKPENHTARSQSKADPATTDMSTEE